MKNLLLMAFLTLGLFAKEPMMENIYNNILLNNINQAISSAQKLENNHQSKTKEQLQKEFSKLVQDWKKVEAFYLAEEFDNNAIDIPRYIDVFHNLKEPLHQQLQRVVESKDDVQLEMYKHSFKTINALEYILYSENYTTRHKKMLFIITQNIINQLQAIKSVYQTQSKRFLDEFKWANDVIINSLIDSSFKLKDWRIGDMAGLSRKYKGQADNRRAEYFLSENSKKSIQAILEVHQEVMNAQTYDFGDMLIKNGYEKEVKEIRHYIDESMENLTYLQNENFEEPNIEKLYKSISLLHKSYYASLVNALGVTSKILDADGD